MTRASLRAERVPRGCWQILLLLSVAGGFTTSGSFLLRPLWPSPRNVRVACRAQESNGPRMYYPEDRGTAKGGAFWGRSTEEQWGEFASGEAGSFDKDDLVEGKYPGTEDWYCAQVMKYIGQGDWIVMWVDDMPDDSAKASVLKTLLSGRTLVV
ncbi:unnamed protein product [Durusdinium trenchii]|uniref:Uncharacterized protein n=1 Tax=Durusdinium trenchii TaxID=1381693 RepID=A0ABP0QRJ9_9DINO